MISTSGKSWFRKRRQGSWQQNPQIPHDKAVRNDKAFGLGAQVRNSMAFRPGKTPLSAHADTEDKKLRKDPLEVLALKVPFGRPYVKPVAFRMKSRGRDN
jgi:hypothetical protein